MKEHTNYYKYYLERTYMYKYIGASLMGLFIFMMFPSDIQTDSQEGIQMYGAATLDYQDESGNSMFTQTVHNQLFDAGEAYILTQIFKDGVAATADATQIGAVCVAQGTAPTAETDDAAAFATANTISAVDTNCIEANFTVNADETADSAANVFSSGTHVTSGDTVNFIGVCSAEGSTPQAVCSGTLFAVVDTSDVTLSGTESVTITYTFDISSAGT